MLTQEIREQGEDRRLGALAVVHRHTQAGHQVLTLRDAQKTETAAGWERWASFDSPPWGFPGGGRGNKEPNKNGKVYPENLAMTLKHELQEELGVALKLLVSQLTRQAYPFMAAQLTTDRATGRAKIDEFAVTSAWLEYDALPIEQQKLVEVAVLRDVGPGIVAQWQALPELQRMYIDSIDHASKDRQPYEDFRPQVLAAAHIWYIDRLVEGDPTLLRSFISSQNRRTHRFIYGQSVPVNNGAFQPDGDLIPSAKMSARDRRYLFGT